MADKYSTTSSHHKPLQDLASAARDVRHLRQLIHAYVKDQNLKGRAANDLAVEVMGVISQFKKP